VFLALPGLNLAPHKLQPLTLELLGRGCAVARPPLRGYDRPGAPEWATVSADDWLADLDSAHAALTARYPGVAPALLGYSMGGLLGLAWSLLREVPLRRAVLISPAFRLVWYAQPLLSALGAVLPGRVRIPSRSPREYALHGHTSLAAYGALLDLVKRFRAALQDSGAGRLPAQFIAYSPADELIATRYYSSYRELAPERVVLHPFSHTPRPGFPHHLGVDAHTLGGSEWAALQGALAAWLAA
jgi:alpha-beta hydrolase superfamily lysophospholipase